MASIHVDPGSVPRIFTYLMDLGNVAFDEMCSTFNMGIGYVMIVSAGDQQGVIELLMKNGEKPRVIGAVKKSKDDQRVEII
jgi:phosphoribosylformylglycinamidine cyclo-ligase